MFYFCSMNEKVNAIHEKYPMIKELSNKEKLLGETSMNDYEILNISQNSSIKQAYQSFKKHCSGCVDL